jgi:hypothetical protein
LPNRILRDGINSSPRVNALSMGAEILYRRLMSVADDYGRFYASTITIRASCWPLFPERITDEEVKKWMAECTSGDRPLLRIYEHAGARYLEIQDFGQQQRSKSKYPNPSNFIETKRAINLLSGCEQNDIRRSSVPNPNTKTDALTTTPTHTTTTSHLPRARKANKTPERFSEWLRPWPRVGNPDAAVQAWISVVVSPDDEAAAFAARDRYLASDEVARSVICEPAKWLYDQARGGWAGRWPAARKDARIADIAHRLHEAPRQYSAAEIEAMAADDDPRIRQVAQELAAQMRVS